MSMFRYGFLHYTTNLDFFDAVSDIASIAKSSKIKDENYLEVIKLFEDSQNKLFRVSKKVSSNAHTKVIKEKAKERQVALRSIQNLVKTMLTRRDDEILKHAKVLDLWLRVYKKEFYRPLVKSNGMSVIYLYNSAEKKPKVREALKFFSIDELFDDMYLLTNEINVLRNKRGSEVVMERKDTAEWRKEILSDLRNLFAIVELLIKTKGDSEPMYQRTANVIQTVVKHHERIYRIKKGMRQGKKEREKLKSTSTEELNNVQPKLQNKTKDIALPKQQPVEQSSFDQPNSFTIVKTNTQTDEEPEV